MDIIEATLEERQEKYGDFCELADFAQEVKDRMHSTEGWDAMTPTQCEALEMIVHKMARILHGDPNYEDSWIDIAGYAILATR